MKKAYDALENISQNAKLRKQEQLDECALYGQLVASKLRNLSTVGRLTLINKIDNLFFQAQLNELCNASPTTNTNNSSNRNVAAYDQLQYPYCNPPSVESAASTSAIDDSSNSVVEYYSQATNMLSLQQL